MGWHRILSDKGGSYEGYDIIVHPIRTALNKARIVAYQDESRESKKTGVNRR